MRTIIVSFLFLMVTNAYGQSYLNESCKWTVKDYAFVDFIYFNSNYTDYIDSDTLIDGIEYYKLYRQGVSISGFTQQDSIYFNEFDEYKGAIREEDKRWHWIEKDSLNPVVLYDFNKMENDSIRYFMNGVNYNLILVDSIFQYGVYKMVYNLEGTVFDLIEGVGYNTGVTSPAFNPESISYLQCFNNTDENLNPDLSDFQLFLGELFEDVETCNDLVLDNKTPDQQQIEPRIYPNPFVDIVKIDSEVEIEEILILDHNGQKLFSEKHNFKSLELDHLEPGCYFIVFKSNQSQMSIQKLVKL